MTEQPTKTDRERIVELERRVAELERFIRAQVAHGHLANLRADQQ
jgi:hypothetical protein